MSTHFNNTYSASPIRAPMFKKKNHNKYVKDYLNYHNNSEVYTSKKIKNYYMINQSYDMILLMMYLVMTRNANFI